MARPTDPLHKKMISFLSQNFFIKTKIYLFFLLLFFSSFHKNTNPKENQYHIVNFISQNKFLFFVLQHYSFLIHFLYIIIITTTKIIILIIIILIIIILLIILLFSPNPIQHNQHKYHGQFFCQSNHFRNKYGKHTLQEEQLGFPTPKY